MNKDEIIDKLLSEIENARQKFLKGEISALSYNSIRNSNCSKILDLNKKKNEI